MGQHIYGKYHGHSIEVTDSNATHDQFASQVLIETTDGSRIFPDRYWRGGYWEMTYATSRWVDLTEVHDMFLSDADSVTDLIIAAQECI